MHRVEHEAARGVKYVVLAPPNGRQLPQSQTLALGAQGATDVGSI
jgi:hypothetical protein